MDNAVANISTFENLQNQANASMGADKMQSPMAAFNSLAGDVNRAARRDDPVGFVAVDMAQFEKKWESTFRGVKANSTKYDDLEGKFDAEHAALQRKVSSVFPKMTPDEKKWANARMKKLDEIPTNVAR